MKAKRILTFCQHDHMGCRIFCRVVDGRVIDIVNGMGVKCGKEIYAPELLYHPDRVIYPLKRVGKRGEGKWERISWDEALDIMAERFGQIKERYGAETIATIRGCGHKQMANMATQLFSRIIGTPNVLDVNEECSVPGCFMAKVTTGDFGIHDDYGPQFLYSKCILLWGSNQSQCRPTQARDIVLAQAKGAKLIVIDPRPPKELNADIWLRVRPGTDGALALGMINIVINKGLYNKDFVDKWCVGFGELKKRVREYTPEKVAEITSIPKEKIIESARLFATTTPSCLHLRLGAGGGQFNTVSQTGRAITNLMAIAGDIDVRGGNFLGDKLGGFRFARSVRTLAELPFPPGVEEERIGAKDFPLKAGSSQTAKDFEPLHFADNTACIQAMLKRHIKAFFIPGSNVVLCLRDSKLTWEALKRLQFLVVVELFMTPTAELADLVLPAAHFLETEIPTRAFSVMGPAYNNYILAGQRVIEPVGECWDDRKIVLELAKRMGVDVPWQNIEDLNDWQLEKVGVKYEDILRKPGQMLEVPPRYKKYEQQGFDTPSGKVELYSSILKNLGHDPLPYYEEPPQSPISTPELANDYPLILIQHRNISYTHSEFRQLPSLRKQLPDQLIEINPETAAGLGIKEGDEIYIERPGSEGQVRGKAKFVAELDPKVVSCLSHWWFPEKPGPEHGCFESNINAIISTEPFYDPIYGNYQLRALLCRVRKA